MIKVYANLDRGQPFCGVHGAERRKWSPGGQWTCDKLLVTIWRKKIFCLFISDHGAFDSGHISMYT
jgi:hypothetical protein